MFRRSGIRFADKDMRQQNLDTFSNRKSLNDSRRRLSAAIELIDTIDAQRVPAAKALKEWGTAHRYAGSGDRAAISGLVWDVLRRRASSAWIMDDDTPRARVLGMLKLERGLDAEAIAALVRRQPFCAGAVDASSERAALDLALAGAKRRRPSPATTRNGSMAIWRRYSATTASRRRPRWRAGRRSICASTP